jgi:hypothetical protein
MHEYACIGFKRHAFMGNAGRFLLSILARKLNADQRELDSIKPIISSYSRVTTLYNHCQIKDKLTGKRVLKPLPGLSRHENTLLWENLAQKFLFLKQKSCGMQNLWP